MPAFHKGALRYKDVVVAPNKNPGSLFMLLSDPKTPSEAIEKAYNLAFKPFYKIWEQSGVDMNLMNYRVGDDSRWKTKEE